MLRTRRLNVYEVFKIMAFLAAIPAMFSAAASAAGAGTAAAGAGTAAAAGAAGTAAAGTGAAAAGAASWLPTLSTTLMAGGTALGAMGQISASRQEAALMDANAKASVQDAKNQQEAAKDAAYELSRERRRLLGTQASLIGMSGAGFVGSPLDVMANTAGEYERDILKVGYMGDVKAGNSMFESTINKWGAKQRRQAGMIGAGGTLLSGFGRGMLKKYGGSF